MSQTDDVAVQMLQSIDDDTTDGVDQLLYIIAHPEGYYKIGVANNPVRRLEELQIGSPYELDIIAFAGFTDPQEAEKALHSRFDKYNVRGEWFKIPQKLMSMLVSDDGETLQSVVVEELEAQQ